MIKDPARFFIVAVAEFFFGIAGIVAGIMIGGNPFETGTIQPDFALRDIFDQQIENRKGAKLLERLRIPFFETRPGREIGVASLAP